MRLEIVVLPVDQVDRAKAFYRSAGFREDLDYACGADFRIVRFTPPGSQASIVFGVGVTAAPPGSMQGLVLGVRDLRAARDDLLARGVPVSDVFHDSGGVFLHLSPGYRMSGPDPDGRDRASFATFSDPDGNRWVLQEDRVRRDAQDPGDDQYVDRGSSRARPGRETDRLEGVPNATGPAKGTAS